MQWCEQDIFFKAKIKMETKTLFLFSKRLEIRILV